LKLKVFVSCVENLYSPFYSRRENDGNNILVLFLLTVYIDLSTQKFNINRF